MFTLAIIDMDTLEFFNVNELELSFGQLIN